MNCKDCLYYERCKKLGIFNIETLSVCEDFTDRSEWVHLPSDEYTFTVHGDIAKEPILSEEKAYKNGLCEDK